MKERLLKFLLQQSETKKGCEIAAHIDRFKSEYELNLIKNRQSFFSLQNFIDKISSATGLFNVILNSQYEIIVSSQEYPAIAVNLINFLIKKLLEQKENISIEIDYDLYEEEYGIILRSFVFYSGEEKLYWISAAFLDDHIVNNKTMLNVAKKLNISYKRFELEFLKINRIHISKFLESLYLIQLFANDLSQIISYYLNNFSLKSSPIEFKFKNNYFLPFEILPLPSLLILNKKEVKANKAAKSFFGLTKDSDFNFDELNSHLISFEDIYNDIKLKLKESNYCEIDIEGKDANSNLVHLKAKAFAGENLREILVCLILIDYTEQRELANKNEIFSLALEKLPEFAVIADKNKKIIFANKSFYNLFKINKNEIIGKDFFETRKLFIKTKIEEKINYTLENKGFWNGRQVAIRKDGSEFIIDTSIMEVRNSNNQTLAILEIGSDVSDKIALEEKLKIVSINAEKAQKIKNDFLAQISHEIRTPLNVILSFISLLKEKIAENNRFDEEYSEYFESIDVGAKRLIRTIDLMVGMAQMQSGSYLAAKEKVYINSILTVLKDIYSYKAAQKKLKFEVKALDDDIYFYADNFSIYSILENIIDNAIKFTFKGGVEVIARINEDKYIVVDVIDTGVGITKEYLNEIFEPFSQEEKGYTRKFDGNGLGLALSKKYADLNNCEIKVSSEKNKGSIFSVIIKNQLFLD